MFKQYKYLISAVITIACITLAYHSGKSAGINYVLAEQAETNQAAYVDYDKKLKSKIRIFKSTYDAELRRYKGMVSKQQQRITELGMREYKASNDAIEIREKIKYVKLECDDIGNDAFRLLKQTRSIISDPRTSTAANGEESKPANPSTIVNTLLRRFNANLTS